MFFEYDPTATLKGQERLNEYAQALRQALLPLRTYVQHRAAKLDIASPYAQAIFQHIRELEAAFQAIIDYDQVVQELIAVHLPREQQAQAHIRQAQREADPVYLLGFVRGYRRGQAVSQQAHERVLSLYAKHAILPTPPGYQPTPFVTRVQRFLGTLTERYGAPLDSAQTTQQAA